jgi:hypothetical protein
MATDAADADARVAHAFSCDSFGGVVSLMRVNEADAVVQVAGCNALVQFIAKDINTAAQAVAAGLLDAVLAALRAHLAVAAVQERGCLALRAAFRGDVDSIKQLAVDAGAFSSALAALRTHPADATVQACACKVIMRLTFSPGGRGRIAPPEAVELVLAALHAHADAAAVQDAACCALSNLAVNSAVASTAAVAAGAFEAILAGFQAPGHQPRPSCLVLQALTCRVRENRVRASSAGVNEALLEVVRHEGNAEALYHACCALANMAGDSEHATRLGELGAVAVVTMLLQECDGPARMITGALDALKRLLRKQPLNLARARQSGLTIALVQNVMDAHASDTNVQSSGSGVVALLQSSAGAVMAPAQADGAAAALPVHAAALTVQAAHARLLDARNAGDVNDVLHIMRAWLDNSAPLQAAGCLALSTIGRSSVAELPTVACITAVLAALRAHVADTEVQRAGCDALAVVCGHDEHNTTAAVQAGALEAVLLALRTHPMDVDVQCNGCHAVSILCFFHSANAERAAAAGAVEAATAALTANAANAKMQKYGLSTLSAVLDGCGDAYAEQVASSGAVEAVMRALARHVANEQVYAQAFVALEAVTRISSLRGRALTAGAMSVAVALLGLPASQQMRLALTPALTVLASLATDAAVAARAGAVNAVQAVVNTMRAHAADANIHAAGVVAIARLVDKSASNAALAHRAGAADLATAARGITEAGGEQLQDAVTTVLARLAACEAAADAAMAALLAEEEAEQAAKAAPAKRKNKKKRGSGTAAAGEAEAAGASGSVVPEAAEQVAEDAAGGADVAPGGQAAAPEPPPAGDGGAAAGAHAAVPAPPAPPEPAPPPAPASPPVPVSPLAPAPAVQPAWPAAGALRTQAPREYRPPMGPPPSTCTSQATQPLAPWQPPQQFAQPPQLSPAQGMLLLPPYLAHLALGGAAPQQAQPPAPVLPPPVLLPPPLLPPAPAAAAAEEPPPPPPVMKECCVCFLDVIREELLLLMPCAHRCICADCADALMATPPPAPRLCPKCRKHVIGASTVFDD